MNYLGHFYLSFHNPEILVGQFVADAIKGNQYSTYPEGIRRGILLHRWIDDFTDSHPACLNLRALIRHQLGLYSPVAIDLYLDHVLAVNWATWHEEPLPTFAARCYDTIERASVSLPERMKFTLRYMKQHNWLTAYATTEGIARSFQGLASRVPAGEILTKAPGVMAQLQTEINNAFGIFFPAIVRETKVKLGTFAAGW